MAKSRQSKKTSKKAEQNKTSKKSSVKHEAEAVRKEEKDTKVTKSQSPAWRLFTHDGPCDGMLWRWKVRSANPSDKVLDDWTLYLCGMSFSWFKMLFFFLGSWVVLFIHIFKYFFNPGYLEVLPPNPTMVENVEKAGLIYSSSGVVHDASEL